MFIPGDTLRMLPSPVSWLGFWVFTHEKTKHREFAVSQRTGPVAFDFLTWLRQLNLWCFQVLVWFWGWCPVVYERHFSALTESAPSMTIRVVERSPAAKARRWELWLCVLDEGFNDPSLGSWWCRWHVPLLAPFPCCFLFSVSSSNILPFFCISVKLQNNKSTFLSVSVVS